MLTEEQLREEFEKIRRTIPGPFYGALWGYRKAMESNTEMRVQFTELGKWADKAAMVLATLDAEDSTEAEQLQEIIDGISKWAPMALLATTPGSEE